MILMSSVGVVLLFLLWAIWIIGPISRCVSEHDTIETLMTFIYIVFSIPYIF